jgi:hypothetical protein
MVDYGKKKERITMQRAIDDMMNQMGLSQLHFVVTADLATKISSLMWKAHPEDLSLGIHPFLHRRDQPRCHCTTSRPGTKIRPNFVRWGLSKPYGCPRASGRRHSLNPTKPHLARRPESTICGAAQSVLWHRAFRHSRLGTSYDKYSTATIEPPILHCSHVPPSATLTGLDPTLVPTQLLLLDRTPMREHEQP